MKGFLFFAATICLSILSVNAQDVFQFQEINQPQNKELSKKISDYQIFEFDSEALFQFRQQYTDELSFRLALGDTEPRLFNLQANELRSDNFILQTMENGQLKTLKRNDTPTFVGELLGQDYGSARITIDENFVMATWQEGDVQYYMEPLWRLLPDAPHHQYIFYKAKSVIFSEGFCGAKESTLAEKSKQVPFSPTEKIVGECLEVEIALASDFEMFQAFGSVVSVENFMLGVLANVQTNYDDEFDDELIFSVVTTFIVSTNAGDPWTNNNDGGVLLGDFASWGNAGGFGGVTYDVASLWSDRNFAGSTIGVAYIDAVCTGGRYSVMENFTNNAALLRVVWAHELGHNFGSNHDSSGGWIMSPSVNNTNSWSNTTQGWINSSIPFYNCLTPCPIGGGAPSADFSYFPEIGCAPLQVDFFDESSGGPEFWEWTLAGASPNFSNQQNPSVTYLDPGTYDVSLYVENENGNDTYSESGVITVLDLPSPDFDAQVDGFVVDFFNNSTNADDYEWDFGDGGFSLASDPIYTYTEAGEYEVTLIAYNDCGNESITMIVVVESTLIAAFTNSSIEGCTPLEVSFFDNSEGNPHTWEWEFPGGIPDFSTLRNPVIDYPAAGSYSISLTVSNDGETDMISFTDFITVSPLAVASFTYTVIPGTGIATFTNTSTNADSYLWDFGDGHTSTLENPEHTYDNEDVLLVTLTAFNDCGNDTHEIDVDIIFTPEPSISVANNTGCSPLTVTYTASPMGSEFTYAWTFPGGNPATSSSANPSISYTTAGSYDATLVVTNAAGSNTVTQENIIVVNNEPQANFDIDNIIGSGLVTFTNQSTNADTYLWNFGDNETSNQENPDHTYTEEGTYTVTLTATNECGSNTHTFDVEIVFLAEPTIEVSANTGCAPLTVTYTASPMGSEYTYTWTFPGGNPATSSSANPSISYTTAGSFDATLVVTNAAGSNTITQENIVVVNNAPQANFDIDNTTGSGLVTFTNQSSNADTYLWDFGDDETSNQENPSHTYTEEGTYTVTLTATNECGSDTHTFDVEIVFLAEPTIEVSVNTGCAPLMVTYTASPMGSEFTYAWTFSGGNPATSSSANPSISYTAAGSYDATLVVTNAAGSNTVTQENIVVVNSAPEANFTTENTIGSGLVTFTNQNTNADTYLWDFGDDETSNQENSSHTYTEEGTYTVTLTATNECGSDTHTLDINIIFPPSPEIQVSTTEGCGPFVVAFQAIPSGDGNSYAWVFPGGDPVVSTLANPTITYNNPGSYDASLTVTNAVGTNTATQTIIVLAAPIATYTFTVNGLTATFTNNSTNVDSYTWNIAGTPNNEENPSFTFPGTGEYEVNLIALNSCGSDEFSATVIIEGQIPNISFTEQNNEGCSPLIVSFESEVQGADDFFWTFTGGTPSSSTEPNPSITYNQPGVYTVILTASNVYGSNAVSQVDIVVVNEPTVAAFDYTLDGATVNLQNTSIAASSLEWQLPNGSTPNDNTIDFTFTGNGTYEVILTAEGNCNSDEISQTIVIDEPVPSAVFSASETEGCLPFTVNFTDQSSNSPSSWEWTFPGGTPEMSTAQNVEVTYTTIGVYDVFLSASNEFGGNQVGNINAITVADVPDTPEFTMNTIDGISGEAFVNDPNVNDTYNWDFGNGQTASGESAQYNYTETGVYTITLTAINDCGETTATEEVNIIVNGVSAPVWASQLSLFPNPTKGSVKLEASGWPANGKIDITLVNILGQFVEQQQINVLTGQWTYNFDWHHISSGTYMVQLNFEGEVWTRKLIVL